MPRAFQSLRFRIVAAFVLALGLVLSAMGFLVVQYASVSANQAMITDGYLPIARSIDRIRGDQRRIDNDIDRLLRGAVRPGTGSTSLTAITVAEFHDDLKEAQIRVEGARRRTEVPQERAVLNKALTQLQRVDERFATYQDAAASLVRAAERGDEAAVQAGMPPFQDGRASLSEELEALGQTIDGRIGSLTAETEAQRNRANAVAAALTVGAMSVYVVLMIAVLAALAPINRLTEQVQRLAAGDYSGRVELSGGDEIASLATEFNSMAQAIAARDDALVKRADELRKLSTYLTSVMDNLQEPLFVLEDGKVTLANLAAQRVWGVQPGSAAPDVLELDGRTSKELTVDGALHSLQAAPFGGGGWVVLTSDITQATRAKERLARSERLALVGQMLAQITHEVRNPLNAMSLNAELLNDELGDLDPKHASEAWDLLDTVSGEIDRLTQVTAHYLQLARRPPAQLSPTHLPNLIQDVSRLLAPELDDQRVQLEVTSQELPPMLIDGQQIRQAVLNVVRNAVDAGANTLQLSSTLQDDDVVLTLSDNGEGMTDEQIQRATDPFFSTKASGTGLGLAITRQILEDHDGGIRISSKPGQGTSLSLIWPLRVAVEELE